MEGNCIQSMPVGRNWKNKVNRRRPSPLHVPIWVKLLWKSSGGAVLDFSSSPPRARPLLNKTPTHNIRRMEARNINVWTVLWIWTCLQMWRGRISTRWTVWLILISRHKMEWKKKRHFFHSSEWRQSFSFFLSLGSTAFRWLGGKRYRFRSYVGRTIRQRLRRRTARNLDNPNRRIPGACERPSRGPRAH